MSSSTPPYRQVEGRPASEAVFSISPTTNKPNLTAGNKTSPGQHSQWLTGPSTATPVLERSKLISDQLDQPVLIVGLTSTQGLTHLNSFNPSLVKVYLEKLCVIYQ